MGEYARYNGEEIKIGTCENMYYLRIEDADKVQKLPGSLGPRTCPDLRFRLPFPDEDHIEPGHYDTFQRGYRLYKVEKVGDRERYDDYNPDWLESREAGSIQLRHEPSGLLLNVPCHHGVKLPETGPTMKAFWNGKGHSMELVFVNRLEDGRVVPIVQCRHCGLMWRVDWAEVLPYVHDQVMKQRLAVHAKEVEPCLL